MKNLIAVLCCLATLVPGVATACEMLLLEGKPSFPWPLQGRLVAGFGMRLHPLLNMKKMHPGVDLAADISTPVQASRGGRVVMAAYDGDYGNTITVDHGNGWETLYAHLQRFAPKSGEGDCVKAGEVIGFVGMTGLTQGPHVHFELRRHGVAVNPVDFLPGRTP
jgi:murein DD-endopeptidase MepM/ murein hydrolase activator NlpD